MYARLDDVQDTREVRERKAHPLGTQRRKLRAGAGFRALQTKDID